MCELFSQINKNRLKIYPIRSNRKHCFFQSPNEIPVLEKIRAGEQNREGSVSGFGTDLSGKRKSPTVGFDYIKSSAAENTDGQL